MKHLRVLAAFVAAVVLLAGITGQAGAQDKKKKKGKRVRPTIGKLVSCDIKDGKGKICIETRGRRKKGDKKAAPGKKVEYEVNAETKVLKSAGKKKTTEAEAGDLKVGQFVFITASEGVATRIVIFQRRKKKDAN